MADAKIRGVTIQLGGDTSGLSKAISAVNKDIGNTQKQLKDVERLLKLDPTNTTLLAQKQQLLGDAVGQTREKLDALKKAEKQVQERFEKGDASKEQYMALQREIIATEHELENLEKAASKSNVVLSKISATADKVAQGASKVASATKGISTAAGGGVTALGAMAVKAGLAADDINTLAKQSGFGTDDIQKWQYAADRIDFSVNDIVSAAGKMKKNMVSTSTSVTEAWERLGIRTRNSNGVLRDSTDVFYEAVEALSKISNETDRDIIAMELFGKGADSLAGIIDDGGAALRAMGEEAEASGLILSQDALDGANAFNDGIDTLKAKATAAFFSSGAALAENLLPMLDELVEVGSEVLAFIAGLDGDTLAMIGTVLLAIAAISPVAGLISGIATAVSGVSSALAFLAANPIVLVVAAVAAAVAAIVLYGDEIKAALQTVVDFLQGVFAADFTEIFGPVLGAVLNVFRDEVKAVWDGLKSILDGIIHFIQGVFTGSWEHVWTGVTEIFDGAFGSLVDKAKVPLNGLISMVNEAINALNSVSFDMPDWLGGGHYGINIPNIPMLAKGGSVFEGDAIVGERGPEILRVANGKAVVEPLAGNSGRSESVLGSSGNGSTAGAETVVLQVALDGKVIGQTAYDFAQRRSRAYG